jgi:hypothetical protein
MGKGKTITLSLEEYTDLVQFKEAVEKEGKIAVYERHSGLFYHVLYNYCTKEEAIKQVAGINSLLESKITSLKTEVSELKVANASLTEGYKMTIKHIFGMNWFGFRKWKKEQIRKFIIE